MELKDLVQLVQAAADYGMEEYQKAMVLGLNTGPSAQEAFLEGGKWVLSKLKNCVFIEKELLSPVNGETVGPYFHVYTLTEDGEKVERFVEKSGDIKAAVREAERQMDLNLLAVAYKKNPDSFRSTIEPEPIYTLSEKDMQDIQTIVNNAIERQKETKENN